MNDTRGHGPRSLEWVATLSRSSGDRGQSAIIGVALLLAITVVSVGVLTAGTGILVDEAAQEADLERIGDTVVADYRPATLAGTSTMTLSLAGGTVVTEPREITISRYGDVVARLQTVALRYERAGRALTIQSGAILQARNGHTTFVREPGMARRFGADGDRVLTLSLVNLTGDVEERIDNPRRVRFEFEATHERRDLDAGRYTIRVETAAPAAWVQYFEDVGADVHTERTSQEGGVVVADFGRVSDARLIIHHVEVQSRG